MHRDNETDVSGSLETEGARIAGTVPTDGKGDRHGHLAYGQAVEITKTYHGKAYTWWSRHRVRLTRAAGREQ